ncbi:TPA_asm: coat protein [ssRNA phage Zoerhiza.2_11]|uniref:Coat protein n=2 Tax=Leviviricetes TaxID=2842243 RepID=A0A8S5L2Y2_9VIRU|nr:coat protein [ssRNA phage Zoerhiza.2_11]QDH87540.1 MAG: hypothetical protein H2Rhizo31703_000002 [Leviviridae sp.]DAD51859.1 TPA_asm: coat protein [ssRNA phage Zoerhiza.2_11]
MFPDPQPVTYNTVAKSLPAVGRSADQSVYKLNDAGTVYELTLSRSNKARNRSVARLQRTLAVTDPIVPAQNITASATVTFTMDFPTAGLTLADVQSLGKAMVGFLTDANLLKLAGGET